MKRILLFLMVFVSLFTITSCKDTTETPTTPPTENQKTETGNPQNKPVTDAIGFAIHYQRKDEDYTVFDRLWLWENGTTAGAEYMWSGTDDYGAYYKATWEEFGVASLQESGICFIVRDADWNKDPDGDRLFDFSQYQVASDGYLHIYLLSGDPVIYASSTGEVKDVIKNFAYAYNQKTEVLKICLETNKPYESFEIKSGTKKLVDSSISKDDVNIDTFSATTFKYNLGTELPDLNEEVTVSVKFKESGETLKATADPTGLYSTPAFEAKYAYDGELGALYTAEKTTFRVWSPISTSIKLRLYRSGTPAYLDAVGNNNYLEYDMEKGEKGTWEYVLNGDYEGYYYTYFVTNSTYPKGREIVDPYAKSTGLNGVRGMIVDFSKTNPEGWEEVNIHEIKATNYVVYETHVADLTSSKTWNGTKENAKLFTGFYETGTKYTDTKKNVTVTTGFDHIKELGVNAVQLLPIFDQANDERLDSRIFNWGYNPLNYNALDGIYSSNPLDGYVKIREFKELVKAYNEAGINIIMDVVYNHTASLDGTNFDVLFPGYYYRYNNGSPSNGSGCGNETASNMYMFKKFMVDSTEFWASEYKLGGFRFDLMAVHDTAAMNALSTNLKENVNENIVVYGEPWTGGGIALPSGFTQATQGAMNTFKGYGAFNDKMRDALIKGGMKANEETGWITNTGSVATADLADIKNGINGKTFKNNVDAWKSVQYVTCHDNYTLYDRIKASGQKDDATIKKMAVLAQSVVMTSQGVGFMLAGEEFLRTKGGEHNSYQSSYEVNELNYQLKVDNVEMMDVYKTLIELKTTGVFGSEACTNQTINQNTDGSTIWYDVVVNGVTYRVAHTNGVNGNKSVNFNGFTVVLDTIGTKEGTKLTGSITLEKYQTIIAKK